MTESVRCQMCPSNWKSQKKVWCPLCPNNWKSLKKKFGVPCVQTIERVRKKSLVSLVSKDFWDQRKNLVSLVSTHWKRWESLLCHWCPLSMRGCWDLNSKCARNWALILPVAEIDSREKQIQRQLNDQSTGCRDWADYGLLTHNSCSMYSILLLN